MNYSNTLLAVLLCLGFVSAAGYAQPAKPEDSSLSFLEMQSVPDGNYLVDLQIDGRTRWLNFQVKGNGAHCVNADDPKLKGLRGGFQTVGNGVFFIFIQNEHYRASQHWVFRKDGRTLVKEVPDRGEYQQAVRVKDDSLTRPNG